MEPDGELFNADIFLAGLDGDLASPTLGSLYVEVYISFVKTSLDDKFKFEL
jgi:hypothetical protein